MMSEENKISKEMMDGLLLLIGFALFTISYLIMTIWDKGRDQSYIDNPDIIPGAELFIGLFLFVPIITFAFYLSVKGMSGIVTSVWDARKTTEDIQLHN